MIERTEVVSRGPDIPGYRVLERLGAGGMATVWLARRERSAQFCVVKVIHSDLVEKGIVQKRFLREAEVTAYLDHPNIARLYDAKLDSQVLYLASEYIGGVDLQALMTAARASASSISIDTVLGISVQVLEALDYAHRFVDPEGAQLQVVHRDLSPRNVMLSFEGQAKVIDFGLVQAKLGDFHTQAGMVSGTARYMSPEQACGGMVDHRSDLFTWGLVMYELLAGRSVFEGEVLKEVLMAVVTQEAAPIVNVAPGVPESLAKVVHRALEKDPEDRFPSASEFLAALKALEEHPPLQAEQLGEVARRLCNESYRAHQARVDKLLETSSEEHIETMTALEPPVVMPLATAVEPAPAPLKAPRTRSQNIVIGMLLGIALSLVAGAILEEWRGRRATPVILPPAPEPPTAHPIAPRAQPLEMMPSDRTVMPKRRPAKAGRARSEARPSARSAQSNTSDMERLKMPTSEARLRSILARAVELQSETLEAHERERLKQLISDVLLESARQPPEPSRVRALEERLRAF